MTFVQFVAVASTVITLIACALAVFSSYRSWSEAKKVRSMTSLQGELVEIRDYMSKVDAWMKRINQRETMTARRAAERDDSSTPVSGTANDKDALRRRAGLRAGETPRHREMQ
jgi:uncharacterized protein (DUF934 family)